MGFQPPISSPFRWSMGEDDPDRQANTFDPPEIAKAHFGFVHRYFSRNRADANFPLTHSRCRSAAESRATDAQPLPTASTLCQLTSWSF